MKPSKGYGWLFVSASLAVLAGCATVSETVGSIAPTGWTESGANGPKIQTADATVYTESEEGAKLSDQIENQGELSQLVLDMPATEALLNTHLARVAKHWPHPLPQQPRVKISMLSEYAGATYADGTILIGLGTFTNVAADPNNPDAPSGPTVSSDEELLYLLAHEFSHYALGHHNKVDQLSGMRSIVSQLTNIYNTAAVLQEVRYQETADGGTIVVTNQNEVANNIESAISTFDLISAYSAGGLSPAWNRGQEDEADVLALDLIKSEGINAPVYEAMFNALHEQETLTKRVTNALQASVADVSQQALQPASLQQALAGNAGQVGDGLFDTLKKSVTKSVRDEVVGYFGQTHRSPSVRLKGVQNYELAAYPDVTAESRDMAAFMEEPTTIILDQLKASGEFNDARIATIAYYSSMDKRLDRDYAGAEEAIVAALGTRFASQSSIQYEAGRVAELAGNPELARLRYMAAIRGTPLPEAYRKLARLDVRKGAYGNAEAIIVNGITATGDEDYFLPSRINLAVARDDVDGAMEYVRSCRQTQRAQLMAACEASHQGLDPTELTAEQKEFFERQGQLGNNPGEGLVEGLGSLFKPKGQ